MATMSEIEDRNGVVVMSGFECGRTHFVAVRIPEEVAIERGHAPYATFRVEPCGDLVAGHFRDNEVDALADLDRRALACLQN